MGGRETLTWRNACSGNAHVGIPSIKTDPSEGACEQMFVTALHVRFMFQIKLREEYLTNKHTNYHFQTLIRIPFKHYIHTHIHTFTNNKLKKGKRNSPCGVAQKLMRIFLRLFVLPHQSYSQLECLTIRFSVVCCAQHHTINLNYLFLSHRAKVPRQTSLQPERIPPKKKVLSPKIKESVMLNKM